MSRRNQALRRASALRAGMTRQERRLWYECLRQCPGRFRRQAVIAPYIVDFYSPSLKLAIELDGSQHYALEGREHDRVRTQALEAQGIQVMRFSNHDVDTGFAGVRNAIEALLREKGLMGDPSAAEAAAPLSQGEPRPVDRAEARAPAVPWGE